MKWYCSACGCNYEGESLPDFCAQCKMPPENFVVSGFQAVNETSGQTGELSGQTVGVSPGQTVIASPGQAKNSEGKKINGDFKSIVEFRTMLVPALLTQEIIKIVFIVGSALIVLSTLGSVLSLLALPFGAGGLMALMSLASGCIGLVAFRVFCELVVTVFFKGKETK